MRIKYPNSDNALESLGGILSRIENRFSTCVRRGHDAAAILYISSLIISPFVTYRGKSLIDMISHTFRSDPRKCICVVRTTTPHYFHSRPSMERLQRESIDRLRNSCYVVVYDPHKEFLNHAKFLIYYILCFNENVIYHGKFYGSTNLTGAGLAFQRNKLGNYEEFTVTENRILRLRVNDNFYLRNIIDLINHVRLKYTDKNYLFKFVEDHLRLLEEVSEYGYKVVSSTTLAELYEVYIELQIVYCQTFAFLDELPGKKLTKDLIEMLMRISPPADPFELEMLTPTNTVEAEFLAEELKLSKVNLKEYSLMLLKRIKEAYNLIKEKYIPFIEKIKIYFDEIEEDFFYSFLEDYSLNHIHILKRLIEE